MFLLGLCEITIIVIGGYKTTGIFWIQLHSDKCRMKKSSTSPMVYPTTVFTLCNITTTTSITWLHSSSSLQLVDYLLVRWISFLPCWSDDSSSLWKCPYHVSPTLNNHHVNERVAKSSSTGKRQIIAKNPGKPGLLYSRWKHAYQVVFRSQNIASNLHLRYYYCEWKEELERSARSSS